MRTTGGGADNSNPLSSICWPAVPPTRAGQMLAGCLRAAWPQTRTGKLGHPAAPCRLQPGSVFTAVRPEAPQLVWLDHKWRVLGFPPPPPQLFQFRDLPWEGSWKQGVYQLQTPIHVPRCWLTSTSKEPTVAVSADRPGLTAAPAFCTVSAGSRWDRNSELACEEKKGRILVL